MMASFVFLLTIRVVAGFTFPKSGTKTTPPFFLEKPKAKGESFHVKWETLINSKDTGNSVTTVLSTLKKRIRPKRLHARRMVRLSSRRKTRAFPEEASFPISAIGRLSEGFGGGESSSFVPRHVCQAACSKGGIASSRYTRKTWCVKEIGRFVGMDSHRTHVYRRYFPFAVWATPRILRQ